MFHLQDIKILTQKKEMFVEKSFTHWLIFQVIYLLFEILQKMIVHF